MEHNKINIFENSKFGDYFTFDDNECIFLEKIEMDLSDGSEQLYKLVVHYHVKYTDGSEKDFASIILAQSDGFVYDDKYVKQI